MSSVEPKYMPNGSGRDGFIFKESRRYRSQSRLPFSQFKESGRILIISDGAAAPMVFNLRAPRRQNMHLLPKAVQYHGDGSGRDNYVL